MVRVFIADDHPVIRTGIVTALLSAKDIEVVGEAGDGMEVLLRSRDEEWDVLLLDMQMPKKSGLEVLRRLRVRKPELHIIVISVHAEALYAMQALKMGASGYICKAGNMGVYEEAIRRVMDNKTYVCKGIEPELTALTSSITTLGGTLYELLSEREMQVFLMIAEGKRITDIGEELNISVKTVSTHRRHILDKLDLESNSEIVRYAIAAKLLL